MFSHIRGKGNAMANKLAKLAKYLVVPQVWLEDIPSDVDSLVLIESSFAVIWIKSLTGFSKKKKKKKIKHNDQNIFHSFNLLKKIK